ASASSGLPVTLGASGACSIISGTTVTMTSGTGTCFMTADQAGDVDYGPAPQATQSTAALLAAQTINFGALPNHQPGDAPFTVSATASSGLPVAFASLTQSVCTTSGANGSTVTLVANGSCTIEASQQGDTNYNAATPVDQSFAV